MPPRRPVRQGATATLSIILIVIGIVMIVRTLTEGGGALAVGLVLGLLFVAAGVGRMYLGRRLTR